jgi:hypothetical protein
LRDGWKQRRKFRRPPDANPMRLQALRINFSFIPPLVVAALPKCPICLGALLGAFGFGAFIQASWLMPLMLVFLGVTLVTLAFRAGRRRGLKPFYLGVAASLIILSGKFYLDNAALVYGGAILLVAASVWNSIPKAKRKDAIDSAQCHC